MLVLALAAGGHGAALAQANANAVAQASDAFGFRSGDDAVGIYDESSVRGFSLEAAGNYRLNGSYFVRNSGVSSFFLESTTVRVGYNTLNSRLPGPSGVVDYRLRDPKAGEPSFVTIGLDAYSQPYADLHLKHRRADGRGSYSAGIGAVFDVRDQQGGTGGESILLAGTGRLALGEGTAQVFAGEYQYERPGQWRFAAAGDALPPKVERGRFLGQRAATEKGQRRIAGVLLDSSTAGRTGVGATAVFSQEDPTRAFTQIFSDLRPDGTARAVLIATPQQRSTAWSGELRAHHELASEGLAQRFDLTLRGRLSRSRFGGSRIVDLGRAPFGEPLAQQPRPEPTDSARLADEVDQWGLGLTYRASWRERLRLNLGVLRTDYRKVFAAGDGAQRRSRAQPWLYNIGAMWRLGPATELYGSYSRGLEEAGVAPASATNRYEVLNAIRVTQRELGVRHALTPGLALVVAGFDTRKPYAGIDRASGAFRFLGEVRHRGVEASLSGRPIPGLSLVVGGVLIDPEISGAEVDAGRIGDRPVAVPRLRAIASVDYAVPGIEGLSLDVATTAIGARPARSAPSHATGEQLEADALTTVNLGLRYRLRVAGRDTTIRAQLLNALNAHAWEPTSGETLNYNPQRRVRLVLTTDF
jgi:iron complex outermembrane receptor protein